MCELELRRPEALRELAGSFWRSPETWPALGELLDGLDAADLRRAETLCPAEVPLCRLVAEMRENHAACEAAAAVE
jgi:hypothetical protein